MLQSDDFQMGALFGAVLAVGLLVVMYGLECQFKVSEKLSFVDGKADLDDRLAAPKNLSASRYSCQTHPGSTNSVVGDQGGCPQEGGERFRGGRERAGNKCAPGDVC